jgi:hypothetical protein
MKTFKIQKITSFSSKLFIRAAGALTVALALVACGGSNGGGSTAPVNVLPVGYGSLGPVTITNCVNCNSIASPMAIDMFDAVSATGAASFTKMQVIVSGAGFTPGISSSYNLYSGSVAFQGQMNVNSTLADSMVGACIIQPGIYYFQTVSAGSMASAGTIQSPIELVSTAGNIRLRIATGSALYKSMNTQATRLLSQVSITSVNGVQCSGNFYGSFN